MAETQKQKMMRLLGISAEEAEKMLADDCAIDKGERMDFDLTKEQEKVAKKMANVTTKKAPTVYNFERKRKENPTKAAIISEIAEFLTKNSENACQDVKITNKERQVSFKIGENDYELTLVQKRKPKN